MYHAIMNMNNLPDTADQQLIFTLLATAGRIERRLDRAVSMNRGISFTEFHMLRTLSQVHGGEATRVDLAAAVNLTPSAVTRALKPLEKLGYVMTVKSERDARRSLASLTDAGLELLEHTNMAVADTINSMSIVDMSAPDKLLLSEKLGKL